jgi:hypothetical protein
MLEALKRSSSTENFTSQSSSSEECLHRVEQQEERLLFSLESVGSSATSEEGEYSGGQLTELVIANWKMY